jgi:hypothetical protein
LEAGWASDVVWEQRLDEKTNLLFYGRRSIAKFSGPCSEKRIYFRGSNTKKAYSAKSRIVMKVRTITESTSRGLENRR